MEKYVQIKNLKEAKKGETIFTSYPNPSKNVSGKKHEEKIINAAKDAKEGKCRLLVWREVVNGTK